MQYHDESPAPDHAARPAIPPGFALCPPQLVAVQAWQQAIYQQAYEQARRAAAAIPQFHRRLFCVWN
jgi:hypothetical protein